MSNYAALELIKRQVRLLNRAQGIQLSAAQQQIALQFNFANFHELMKVASQTPMSDQRVLLAAFGVTDLKQAIWEDDLPKELDELLEDRLNGEIAETNAWGYSAEDIEIESASYDDTIGKLTLTGSLTYSGYQDEDRAYCGTAFYLDVELQLLRRDSQWVFDEESGLEILTCESDVDRDHELELHDLRQSYLAGK